MDEATVAEPLRLVLASASPRRRDILSALGLPFITTAPDIEEDRLRSGAGNPEEVAEALALAKAWSVSKEFNGAMILGADTLVCFSDKVLGKPRGLEEARHMLLALRGRRHKVITALALIPKGPGAPLVRHLSTTVSMRRYSEAEVDQYVSSGEPLDKAGAYAIQSYDFHPAARIDGCYFNVVGLPICTLAEMLRLVGIQPGIDTRKIATCKYQTCL